jgi:hypothetical protein
MVEEHLIGTAVRTGHNHFKKNALLERKPHFVAIPVILRQEFQYPRDLVCLLYYPVRLSNSPYC